MGRGKQVSGGRGAEQGSGRNEREPPRGKPAASERGERGTVEASVRLRGTRPRHPGARARRKVEANVKLCGASPRHPGRKRGHWTPGRESTTIFRWEHTPVRSKSMGSRSRRYIY